MDFDLMINSSPKLLVATLVTLKLLSLSLFFGLIIGLIFSVMRLSKNKFISTFSYGFSYVFRGTPEGFPMTLYPEVRKFYLFCEGGGANIDGMKREQIFIELLETIHPDEAQVVIAMKDKKFTELYSNITYDLVRQALPEIKLPAPEAKKPKGKKPQKT